MTTVLVVDDSAMDRRLVDGILRDDPTLTVETVENGHAALARMNELDIDVVVTDLQMPDIDGLQLVTTIRIDHPHVPVILMTGKGSESIAVDALQQGAASYVPKPQLADRLLETVQEVLTIAQASQAYDQLLTCFNATEFELSLTNNVDLFEPLTDYVQQIVTGMQLCDATGGYQIGVAMREALLNALYRGNLEITREQLAEQREKLLQGIHTSIYEDRASQPPYCDRKIQVSIRIDREQAKFVIRDEGPGFDASIVPLARDVLPLEAKHGRGLILIRNFMDEVTFNETGNEVTMVKRRATE